MNDRRKFPRYPEYLYLNIFVSDENSTPSKIINFKGRTLDCSRGGFRIESLQELSTGSLIGFESDDDNSVHSMSGIGEVKWCRRSKKQNYFEFGIAFPILVQPRECVSTSSAGSS
ncbi:MAG: PilZ domain-containing protein [Desulfobulbaceae bacterium]|nr:PilZ domain-containing protein [Desulfobulbaceae bacterium]